MYRNIRKNVEEGKGLQYLPGFSCIEGFFRNGHPDGYGNSSEHIHNSQ